MVEGKHNEKRYWRLVFDLWNLGHSKSHVKEPRNDDAYGYVIYVPFMGQPCKAGSMGVYIYISAWGLVACSDVKGKS